jgi:LPS-assembly protein
MRPEYGLNTVIKRKSRVLLATCSVAGLFALTPLTFSDTYQLELQSANAQNVQASQIFDESSAPSGEEQLLLESDQLTFDNDRSVVVATGNVQIAYGESTLVADRVEYNQQSGRLIAAGNVEILEPNGNRIFAEEIDITDDFRDGFISALNIATPDNTRIAAESAERRDGEVTTFNNGVYTACKACKDNPQKPPFWSIRAAKVVINEATRTIDYEEPTFEFFGKPVFKLAHFSHADPAIKRKSGFLIPRIRDNEELGISYRQGYFFNLAPNYDLTVYGTYYSRQGFLGEAEWRHRTENGEYSISYAGIDQQEPEAFRSNNLDATVDDRHALITKGRFDINSRWKVGWDALFQTDANFARTYDIQDKDDTDITNEIFLVGIGEKNYFDLRAQDFLVQSTRLDQLGGLSFPGDQSATDQQATLLPLLDYNAVSGEEFENGQISLNVNVASVSRDAAQISNFDDIGGVSSSANERFTGLEGNTTRISGELEWKASSISTGGLVSTASLSVRGDAIFQDTDNLNTVGNPLLNNESIYRVMPAGMFEIRYPMVAQTETASHIFEPIAQIVVRPDEENIGQFANEDAQSLVFDTSNLFERDKFSGYDRVEGGTRANIGFRYAASLKDGGSFNFVAGQSFHLAGLNSFAATNDLVNVGQESGLETDRSDIVASLRASNGRGFSTGVAVRLDEKDLDLNRAEVDVSVNESDYAFRTSYTFTEAQPNYRFDRDRHEISGVGSLRLDENWRVFGSASYDIEDRELFTYSAGIGYDNDCFSFSLSYTDNDNRVTGESTGQTIGFSLGLRTIGGFERDFDFGDN